MQILKVQKLTKSFGKKNVIEDVSFTLKSNQIISLVGSSGCGKTTTAHCISGVLKYREGSISLKGQKLEKMNTKQKNIWLRN